MNSSPSNLLRNSNIVLAPKPFKSLEPRFDRCSSSVEESDNGGYPHPNNHSQLLQQPQQYNQVWGNNVGLVIQAIKAPE